MVKRVVWAADFEATFRKIKDKATKEKITKQIEKVISNPEVGKPLSHSHRGERRIRLGSYRLIYAVEGETLYILSFRHRKEVYD